jgi:hypothetical protein
MFDDELATEALSQIDDWQRDIEHRAEQAQALARRTAELSATAYSDDGLVEVTVGPDGQLQGLRLDEGIRRQAAATTARRILDTLRAAKSDLVRQFGEVTAETVGSESETGRALLASLRRRLGPVDDLPDDGDLRGAIR